jgi:hypothetical protein
MKIEFFWVTAQRVVVNSSPTWLSFCVTKNGIKLRPSQVKNLMDMNYHDRQKKKKKRISVPWRHYTRRRFLSSVVFVVFLTHQQIHCQHYHSSIITFSWNNVSKYSKAIRCLRSWRQEPATPAVQVTNIANLYELLPLQRPVGSRSLSDLIQLTTE